MALLRRAVLMRCYCVFLASFVPRKVVVLWRCRVFASCCAVALLLRLSSVFFAAK